MNIKQSHHIKEQAQFNEVRIKKRRIKSAYNTKAFQHPSRGSGKHATLNSRVMTAKLAGTLQNPLSSAMSSINKIALNNYNQGTSSSNFDTISKNPLRNGPQTLSHVAFMAHLG